jgi:hypothetical protein
MKEIDLIKILSEYIFASKNRISITLSIFILDLR